MSTAHRSLGSRAGPCKPAEVVTPRQYLEGHLEAVRCLPVELIERITDALLQACLEARAVYLFGNGGSAALASHFACDLGKGTIANGARRFRVLSLTDNVPLITAWANDTHYENIFAEQLLGLIQPGDIAFAISGSGNSPNVLNALLAAKQVGAINIGLSGYDGGKMKLLCDLCLVVPSENMQHIEDLQLCITHAVFTALRHHIQRLAKARSATAMA